MADGAAHYADYKRLWPYAIGLAALGIASIAYVPLSIAASFSLGAISWYWLAQFIDPDLDHIAITSAEGRALRGGWLGYQWVKHWLDYVYLMSLFGGHRSWMSHSVIPGTVIRLIHACLFPFSLPIIGWGMFAAAIRSYSTFALFAPEIAAFLASGLLILGANDAMHIRRDRWTTSLNKSKTLLRSKRGSGKYTRNSSTGSFGR